MLRTGLQSTRRRGGEDRFCNDVKGAGLTGPISFVEHKAMLPMINQRQCGDGGRMMWNLSRIFVLGDLWESFKEWSAYGAGVPLILNDSDCVVQYYVPYLSGIKIYADSTIMPPKPRQLGEDSDSDFRDSSSDGSSDYEHERGLKCSREQWNHSHATNDLPPRMDGLSLRDQCGAHQEDFFSDEGEYVNSQGCLLFEYLEQDPPYSREPLADKISDYAFRFPELNTRRSCDLLPSSWISVAWYPIYRIPTGPTLKDLDACFLTFHSLYTSLGGGRSAQAPVMTYSNEVDGVSEMSLPVFGLASYKFKGSLWTSNGECDHQLSNSLFQAADKWLRLLQVNHPDFPIFLPQLIQRYDCYHTTPAIIQVKPSFALVHAHT
ncbi:hypothetical protein H0E87_015803 [Populus deltoides]|uniref:Uncharacterized protein n=1 Tax=Populus deltoides TaxID=3696 RepID=A0A8T2Y6F3_POPDE|nr:hypothetical protein H0E87_015803 [Populus deltoides]